jgi:hypothetical protein
MAKKKKKPKGKYVKIGNEKVFVAENTVLSHEELDK